MTPVRSLFAASGLFQRSALLLLALGGALPALSAPPPGHLTPGQAREMMLPDKPPSLEALQHEGRVLSTLDANQLCSGRK